MRRIQNRDYTIEGEYEVMIREFLISRGFCCHSSCRHCPYQNSSLSQNSSSRPRLVSLVPSWTETLFAAGANVVGCTRYCIHPQDLVQNCIKLGGTKSLDLLKLQELRPDYVIMDKEENTKAMAESCSFPILPSHICSLEDLENEFEYFSKKLNLPLLQQYAQRTQKVRSAKRALPLPQAMPGVLDWWQKPSLDWREYQIVYIIWKKPFMCIAKETYIGSVLSALGLGDQLWSPVGRGLYPEFTFSELPPKCILLFSSEPFPFAKFKEEYQQSRFPYPAALVNGESFSWFGLRSLRFLEDQLLPTDAVIKPF